MADQMISSFVGKLVDYVAVPVGRQFSYLFRYSGNLEEFRSQLRGLEVARDDVKLQVEAAERNGEVILPTVDNWLKGVDTVFIESQLFVEEEDAISKNCFNGPPNLKVRYQRSRNAMKKTAKFDRIKKDGKFDLVALPAAPLPIGSMNNENEIDFESRRSVFNEIMDAIKDDGVQMIGIWGMPGIGKTTLVKRVGKHAKDKKLFEEVAMAVVSQNPSVRELQSQIADTIGLKFTSESKEGRAGELFQRLLATKKILVILDDIWKPLELNDIGIPSGSQHKGCKVILTSRKRGVCEEMRTRKNFTIDLLSANEALDLFLRMSGIDNRLSEKGRLAKNLSEECGRLPIAIVIVAGGLFDKEQCHWNDMLNGLRKFHPDEKVHAIIKLSYDNLSREEERTFFLLCALFPEDYEIPVRVLFEYGIGLDLFERVDNLDEALVRAEHLASSLKSSSLLLDGRIKGYVKMHDVVRDVALDIASEGKNVFLVRSGAQLGEWTEKTAISLWSDHVKKLPETLECPQLKILMLKCRHPDLQLHDDFFVGMRNLLILDMSGMKFVRLPQSFAGLQNLRTLRLSYCKLGDISTIGKLRNLVSLTFSYSDIEVLPKEVGELSNLRLLDLSWCERLKVITPGVIQNLSQLEVLYMATNVFWSDAEEDFSPKNASLSELTNLSRLMILEICIRNASMLPNDEVLFENLTKFKISIGDQFFNFSKVKTLKLESLSANELTKAGIKTLMKKAQHLELNYVSGISVALPAHSGGFGTLKELIVRYCEDVKFVLDVKKSEYELETPSLQLLYLIKLPLLKEITMVKFPSMFVSELEHLKLFDLPSLVHLWQFPTESVALTNLTTIEIESCHELKYIFDRGSAKSLLKLKKLTVQKCKNLQAIYLSKEEEQDDDVVFPLLSQLKLSMLDDFTSFDSKFSLESTLFGKTVILPALETLDIDNLDKIEKIWHIHTPVESFFQLKVLKLRQCPQILVVFPPQATLDHQLLTFFPKLKKLQFEGIDHLPSNADPLHIIKGLEALEELIIKVNNVKTLLQVIATLPKLRKLQLSSNCESMEWRESLYGYKGFQSLTSLKFYYCNGLKSLLTTSAANCLVQLQELFVNECAMMESIVGETTAEQNFDKVIEFSKLHTLRLSNLPHLTSFNNGECALKFPCLGDFSIECCSQLKTFTSMTREAPESSHQNFESEALFGQLVSFGRLSMLKLEEVKLIEEIWHSDHPATTMGELSLLEVKHCDRLLKIFPSNLLVGLQNLERLYVRSCASLEHVFAVEDHHPPLLLSNLCYLELFNLPKLKRLWWSENTCASFGLPSLISFVMVTCPALQYVFDASVANHLENLGHLEVRNCSSIVEIVEEKPGRKITFPLLDNLYLKDLPRFKGLNQYVEFPQPHNVHGDRWLYTKMNVKRRRKMKVKTNVRGDRWLHTKMNVKRS